MRKSAALAPAATSPGAWGVRKGVIWKALTVEERATALATLAESLAGYGKHFADLIVEETGMDEALAIAEIQAGLGVLRGLSTDTKSSGVVVAVLGDERAPLLGLLRHAVPALLAGAAVVVKPSPRAPSAAFALAELTAESGFPAGVFNILHGDLAAIEGLCAAGGIAALHFSGDPALGARVAAIAGRHGKVFVD